MVVEMMGWWGTSDILHLATCHPALLYKCLTHTIAFRQAPSNDDARSLLKCLIWRLFWSVKISPIFISTVNFLTFLNIMIMTSFDIFFYYFFLASAIGLLVGNHFALILKVKLPRPSQPLPAAGPGSCCATCGGCASFCTHIHAGTTRTDHAFYVVCFAFSLR